MKQQQIRRGPRWYDVWGWPAEAVDELRRWRIFSKVSKDPINVKRLSEHDPELRVDRIGRIYTVVNLPEQLREDDKESMWMPYVVDQLSELNVLLMEMRLNDLAYPEIERVELENSHAYLIVITPFSGEVITWYNLGGWVLRLGLLYGVWLLGSAAWGLFSDLGSRL